MLGKTAGKNGEFSYCFQFYDKNMAEKTETDNSNLKLYFQQLLWWSPWISWATLPSLKHWLPFLNWYRYMIEENIEVSDVPAGWTNQWKVSPLSLAVFLLSWDTIFRRETRGKQFRLLRSTQFTAKHTSYFLELFVFYAGIN